MCVKGWSWLKPGPSHPQLLQGWLSVGRSCTTCAHDSGKHWADRAVHRVGPKNQASTNLVPAWRVWKNCTRTQVSFEGWAVAAFSRQKKLFCALWLFFPTRQPTENPLPNAQIIPLPYPNVALALLNALASLTCSKQLNQDPRCIAVLPLSATGHGREPQGGTCAGQAERQLVLTSTEILLSSDQTAWPEERDTYLKGKFENRIAAGLVESTPDRGWVILSAYGQTKANFILSSPGYVLFFFVSWMHIVATTRIKSKLLKSLDTSQFQFWSYSPAINLQSTW